MISQQRWFVVMKKQKSKGKEAGEATEETILFYRVLLGHLGPGGIALAIFGKMAPGLKPLLLRSCH